MISSALIEQTAETLMAKAAIEIPDDYLTGLKAAAATEACSNNGVWRILRRRWRRQSDGVVSLPRKQKVRPQSAVPHHRF